MDDLISRQAALKGFAEFSNGWCYINALPTAEPRKGRWMWSETGFKCSECLANGGTLECMTGVYRYCPNCGARMEVE